MNDLNIVGFMIANAISVVIAGYVSAYYTLSSYRKNGESKNWNLEIVGFSSVGLFVYVVLVLLSIHVHESISDLINLIAGA